jgi:hypothetical protein
MKQKRTLIYPVYLTLLFLIFSKVCAEGKNSQDMVMYTVKPGDTLWSIAITHYGSGEFYTHIARENSLLNPSLIHSGNIFKITPLSTDGWYFSRSVYSINKVEDIYSGVEDTLPQLPPNHTVRLELEKELAQDVRKHIEDVRNNSSISAAKLLLSSIRNEPEGPTFASWMARRGKVIGEERCYEIGMEVVSEMKFSVEEAQKILNK